MSIIFYANCYVWTRPFSDYCGFEKIKLRLFKAYFYLPILKIKNPLLSQKRIAVLCGGLDTTFRAFTSRLHLYHGCIHITISCIHIIDS